MSKFVTGKKLIDTVDSIIWEAEKVLLIVSPFIKLDEYFKKLFGKHKNNPELQIIIVFGKNETDVKRSFNQEDFDFFKLFPNISIIYTPNLHAKYYGNEDKGVVTSINLYDASFKNNIEFGIYTEHSLLTSIADRFSSNVDMEAWDECKTIADSNDVVFIKRPVYKAKKGLLSFGKDYVDSEVLADHTKYFYKGFSKGYKPQRMSDFPEEISLENIRPFRQEHENPEREPVKVKEKEIRYKTSANTGYCIRTGEPIPFNPSRPFCYNAWQSWAQWENYDFQEKYCHRTGKPSHGKTSMNTPILYDE